MSWELRVLFALSVTLSVLIMKAVSLIKAGNSEKSLGFWVSPLCSINSWRNAPKANPSRIRTLCLESLFGACSLLLTYLGYFSITRAWDLRGLSLSYLALIPAFVLGWVGLNPLRLLYLATGRVIPPIHRNLLRSRSIGEFWGNYNVWVSDWFLQMIFRPLQRRPLLASFCVFVFSGVWHELLVNIPLLLLFHVNCLGSMILYFSVQWVALLLDHTFRALPSVRRAILLLFVIGPAPLFFNESILRIYGWWRA